MNKFELIKMLLSENENTEETKVVNGSSPYEVGKSYHVRTVTMAIAGTLKAVYDKELVFSGASWVADSGRFNEYLKDTSIVSENEPFKNDVIVNREAVIDATEIASAYMVVK